MSTVTTQNNGVTTFCAEGKRLLKITSSNGDRVITLAGANGGAEGTTREGDGVIALIQSDLSVNELDAR